MFARSFSAPENARRRGPRLRRAGAVIGLLGAVALWLWALPALVARDGVFRRVDGCAQASYRDPITGRSTPAPSARIAVGEPCTAHASANRP